VCPSGACADRQQFAHDGDVALGRNVDRDHRRSTRNRAGTLGNADPLESLRGLEPGFCDDLGDRAAQAAQDCMLFDATIASTGAGANNASTSTA